MSAALLILVLSFFQNVSFSMVSRARNRSSTTYHLLTSIVSNTVWFLCFRELVTGGFDAAMLAPYIIGTCAGSLVGAKISMRIEALLDASADGHLKQ